MCGNVPDRNGGNGVSRRQALGMLGATLSGGGVLAGLKRSDAFTTAGTDRGAQVDIEQDSDAIVPITGKTAASTPEFGNEFGTDLTITLSAPSEPSATFDVGETGTTESVATFTVAPDTTTMVGMDADTTSISVAIDGEHGNGAVFLTRDFGILQAVKVNKVQNFQANSGGQNNWTIAQVQVEDIDGDTDLDQVTYEIVDSGGTTRATQTDSASGQQYQQNITITPTSYNVSAGETYTLTVTGFDVDGNSASETRTA